jgi:hypothetical protein
MIIIYLNRRWNCFKRKFLFYIGVSLVNIILGITLVTSFMSENDLQTIVEDSPPFQSNMYLHFSLFSISAKNNNSY